MKNYKTLALVLSVLPTLSFATSPRLPNVAPVLKRVQVTEVAAYGSVVRSTFQHPTTRLLIAIPAKVEVGDACTHFAGQLTTVDRGRVTNIHAMASTSPLTQACIRIAVAPVDTEFTVEMNVVTGGIVAANPIQRKTVLIDGLGSYLITLNMNDNSVKVDPAYALAHE